jgi:hypothetical protein
MSRVGTGAVEESGIVDGAVVMDLAPVVIEQAEDARRTEGKIEDGGGGFKAATLAADGVEQFTRDVERIVVELGRNASGPSEKFFVHTADFGPAAFGAADGIVQGDVVGRRPILSHEDDVSRVKCAIKLSESVTWMSEITKIFEAGDGIEQG